MKPTEIKECVERGISGTEQVLKDRRELLSFVERYEDVWEEIPYSCSVYFDKVIFAIPSLEDLHKIRRVFRKNFLGYTDERGVTFQEGENMTTCYECKVFPLEIRLSTPAEEFPKELQSDKCKVVRLPDVKREPVKVYRYVCKD